MLAELRRVLRTAVSEHQGREVDCRADELFAVFEQATWAVASAAAAQHALAMVLGRTDLMYVCEWVERRPGHCRGRGVLGSAVNRAARICSAGHGGQVLVSQTVEIWWLTLPRGESWESFALAGFSHRSGSSNS